MDSSETAQFELVVAGARCIRYKRMGRSVLRDCAKGLAKKPYREPKLKVYGDIRAMTKSVASTQVHRDGKTFAGMHLKTH